MILGGTMDLEIQDKLKLCQLQLLDDLLVVCNQLNIKFQLTYGTCLGAMRHQGFIPWDDDLDVMMFREDYDILMDKGQELLSAVNENCYLQDPLKDVNYPLSFAKLRLTNTILDECQFGSLDVQQGVFIDIFPLDKISADPKKRNKTIKKAKFQHRKADSVLFINKNLYSVKAYAKAKIINLCFSMIYPNVTKRLVNSKNKINELILDHINEENYSNVIFCISSSNMKYHSPEIMKYGKTLMFEGREHNVPYDTDAYLSQVYGDYMKLPPIEERKEAHHFDKIEL